jgi:rubrerythrin
MYPEFIEIAKKERNKQAEWSFNVANQVEEIHAGLYQRTLQTLKSGGNIPEVDYYVCKVCGNTVEDEAPEKCPICGTTRAQFFRVS